MFGLTSATILATSVMVPSFSAVHAEPGQQPTDQVQIDERFTVVIDDALRPSVSTVATYGRRGEVEVAGIAGPEGRLAEFTIGELLVSGDDDAHRAAEALGGEIVATVSPAEAGVTEVANFHLLTFDPGSVDTGRLVEDLASLQPDVAHGDHRVTSKGGLATLAAAASLTREGVTVGLDWLTTDSTIRTRSTTEAPTGLAAFGTNAFAWSPLTSIGVPEAWNVLARAGRLVPGVIPLAIIDSGYSPADADRPTGGFSDPAGPSSIACSGGVACPFHGSDVASTAMAVPDNGFGAAGPAGPVARPILIDRGGAPLVADLAAHVRAVGAGARIINMSFSGAVPAVAAPFLSSYDQFTAAVRNSGVLQVASAGNTGTDVDTINCFIACWEATYVFPCENTGVICVGGLGLTGTSVLTTPAGGSNFGSGGLDPTATVEAWASFTSIVGPNTASLANSVRFFPGTSASAPLVSGVLGLIWAANPVAPAGTVEATLLGTARPGSCSAAGRCANRIVDALAGVRVQLPNLPPDVSITATSSTTVPRGTAMTFAASAVDPDGPAPTVRWFVDGSLRATGTTFSYVSLTDSFGPHVVSATATDAFGFVVPDAQGGVPVMLINTAPAVQITAPVTGTVLTQWRSGSCWWGPNTSFICPNFVTVSATSTDPNNNPSGLPDANLSWHLDGSSIPFAVGHAATLDITGLGTGAHTITAKGSDGALTGEASVSVTIVPLSIPRR